MLTSHFQTDFILSIQPQIEMPEHVYGRQAIGVEQRIVEQPVSGGGLGSVWDSLIIDGRKTHQPCTV